MISKKFDEVMQSGLHFHIVNLPIQNDQLWDIKIFWRFMEYNGKDVVKEHGPFDGIEDCLDDMLDFLHFYNQTNGA